MILGFFHFQDDSTGIGPICDRVICEDPLNPAKEASSGHRSTQAVSLAQPIFSLQSDRSGVLIGIGRATRNATPTKTVVQEFDAADELEWTEVYSEDPDDELTHGEGLSDSGCHLWIDQQPTRSRKLRGFSGMTPKLMAVTPKQARKRPNIPTHKPGLSAKALNGVPPCCGGTSACLKFLTSGVRQRVLLSPMIGLGPPLPRACLPPHERLHWHRLFARRISGRRSLRHR